MTTSQISRLSKRLVTQLGKQSAINELRWLRQAAADFDNSQSQGGTQPTSSFERLLERRVRGEPLQYILGTQPFGPLELRVRSPVLIPRPETEDWVTRLANLIPSIAPTPSPSSTSAHAHSHSHSRPLRILDLCTGTGCIPLLLSHLSTTHSTHALAIDISQEAIELAQENAKYACPDVSLLASPSYPGTSPSTTHLSPSPSNSIKSVNNANANANSKPPSKSTFHTFSTLQADILSPSFLTTLQTLNWGPFDILTSNPPYIPLDEYTSLPACVKDYEDPRALLGDPHLLPSTGSGGGGVSGSSGVSGNSGGGSSRKDDGSDGLTFYQTLSDLVHSPHLIRPGGLVALEVGHNQAWRVRDLLLQARARARARARQRIAPLAHAHAHAPSHTNGSETLGDLGGRDGNDDLETGGRCEVWKDPWGVERAVVYWM